MKKSFDPHKTIIEVIKQEYVEYKYDPMQWTMMLMVFFLFLGIMIVVTHGWYNKFIEKRRFRKLLKKLMKEVDLSKEHAKVIMPKLIEGAKATLDPDQIEELRSIIKYTSENDKH